MLPADLADPKVQTGYRHVQRVGGQPSRGASGIYFQARLRVNGVDAGTGPARMAPADAAQDYCDWLTNNGFAATATLKSAGHPKAKRRRFDADVAALRAAVSTKERARRAGLTGHVYVVAESGNTRSVKVGHTYQDPPQARLNGLQTGNPRLLKMVACKPGTEDDEKALHAKYIKQNVLGEWFRPTTELLSEFNLTKDALR